MEKRLIDANALKEDLKDPPLHLSLGGMSMRDVLQLVDYAPTIDAVPHWIPCKERMPEEYNQYLVCTEEGEYLVYWFEDSDWARRLLKREGIIAWMPLPEPYVGERKDDETN